MKDPRRSSNSSSHVCRPNALQIHKSLRFNAILLRIHPPWFTPRKQNVGLSGSKTARERERKKTCILKKTAERKRRAALCCVTAAAAQEGRRCSGHFGSGALPVARHALIAGFVKLIASRARPRCSPRQNSRQMVRHPPSSPNDCLKRTSQQRAPSRLLVKKEWQKEKRKQPMRIRPERRRWSGAALRCDAAASCAKKRKWINKSLFWSYFVFLCYRTLRVKIAKKVNFVLLWKLNPALQYLAQLLEWAPVAASLPHHFHHFHHPESSTWNSPSHFSRSSHKVSSH